MNREELFQGMSEPELQSFVDHCTGIVVNMQPFSERVETVCDRVISQEASRLALRQEIKRDMVGRFNGRPMPAYVDSGDVDSGDPGDQLDKLTHRLMAEKGLDYNAALLLAQRERADLAEKVKAQLDAFRNRE